MCDKCLFKIVDLWIHFILIFTVMLTGNSSHFVLYNIIVLLLLLLLLQ